LSHPRVTAIPIEAVGDPVVDVADNLITSDSDVKETNRESCDNEQTALHPTSTSVFS
jgi:hypothetical protein